MIEIRPFATLGGADHGWLKAKHQLLLRFLPGSAAHALGGAAGVER